MKGSIYLIGGGEIRDGETHQIDEELKSLAPEGSNFVFFGFAAQDSVEYSNTITSVFGDKFTVLVPTEEKGRDYAISAIKSASVIYLGGGDTDRLIRLFSEWGLVEYLTSALDRGVHIAGMSAGALALSLWYIHEDNNVFEMRKGWGIAAVGTLVHANQDSFGKAKSLWADLHRDNECSFVAIGERAAWRISTSGEQKIGSGDIWRMNC
jgi:dipeptidase E